MTSQPDPGTPDFNDLTEAEKRVVAERLLKIQKSGWKPFWCPNPTCSGDPHPLLDENGWEQFEPEDAVLGPAGQPLSQDVYEDEDGNLLGRMVLDPQWAHNHSRVDQRLLPWSRPWTLAMLSGRGGGKTEVGAHFIHLCHRKGVDTAILGRRGTELVNTHVKRILETAHPDFMPVHWASKDILEWPNGTTTYLFSAEKPENIRSVNVGAAWVDEGAHMPEIDTAWTNLKLATRIESPGNPIHILVTSTPTPTKWVMDLEDDPKVVVRRVSTYANRANLSDDFLEEMRRKYEGTRIGRQELHGEVLRDVEGALWNEDMHHHQNLEDIEEFEAFLETMDDIVVAVDPAGSKGPRSDATGITAMGRQDGVRLRGGNTHGYFVLAAVEKKGSPNEWAEEVFKVARHVRANRIIVERNFGGDMVKQTLSDYAALNPDTTCDEGGVPFRIVEERAVKSKETRAEPLVGAYEQSRVQHVVGPYLYGDLSTLEKEQLGWVPKSRGGKSPSPNLIDAEVWCFTNLHKGVRHKAVAASQKDIRKLIKRRRAA